MVPEKQLITDPSPIAVMKALKNEVEVAGINCGNFHSNVRPFLSILLLRFDQRSCQRCCCSLLLLRVAGERDNQRQPHRDIRRCLFGEMSQVGKISLIDATFFEVLIFGHFLRKQVDYVGASFETISASGPNGAIIHYDPTPETNRVLVPEEMYLCDSGGQYK